MPQSCYSSSSRIPGQISNEFVVRTRNRCYKKLVLGPIVGHYDLAQRRGGVPECVDAPRDQRRRIGRGRVTNQNPAAMGQSRASTAQRRLSNFVGGAYVATKDGPHRHAGRPEHRGGVPRGPAVRAGRRGRGHAGGRRGLSASGGTPPRPSAVWPCSASPTPSRPGPRTWSGSSAQNTGKPVAVTMAEEIPPMVDQIRFFAGAARHLEGNVGRPSTWKDHTSFIRREPIGVCARR